VDSLLCSIRRIKFKLNRQVSSTFPNQSSCAHTPDSDCTNAESHRTTTTRSEPLNKPQESKRKCSDTRFGLYKCRITNNKTSTSEHSSSDTRPKLSKCWIKNHQNTTISEHSSSSNTRPKLFNCGIHHHPRHQHTTISEHSSSDYRSRLLKCWIIINKTSQSERSSSDYRSRLLKCWITPSTKHQNQSTAAQIIDPDC
jgi:hypothetical protein